MRLLARTLRFGAFALLVAFLIVPQRFAPLFAPLTEYGAPPIYDQGSLLNLALAQLGTVFLATALSAIVAISLAIFVTRSRGAEFLPQRLVSLQVRSQELAVDLQLRGRNVVQLLHHRVSRTEVVD